MRTLIDIPDDQIDRLDRISREERRSRAAIVRAAIADYLQERERAERRDAIRAGFGLWENHGIDGLDYQERMRAEWDRDPTG